MSEDKKIQLKKMFIGHYIEAVPESCNKKVSYVMQGDGLWRIRKAAVGTFITHVAKAEIPGLESNLEESWQPNVPKIPMSLLYSTINFFKEIHKKMKSEVYVQFYYDKEEEEYILHCPEQTVSAASVNYDNDEQYNADNYVLVLEMHSHGSMGAFFSSTDDRDEKADRFFGVVGNVSSVDPDMKFRLCLGGKEQGVSMFSVFQSEDCDSEFPEEWLDRIKEEKKISKWQGSRGRFGGAYGGKYFGGARGKSFGSNHGKHGSGSFSGIGKPYSSSIDDPTYGFGWDDYEHYSYSSRKNKEKQRDLFEVTKEKFTEEGAVEVSDELDKALEETGEISGELINCIREDGLIHFLNDEGVVISSIDDGILTDEDVYDDVDGSFYDGEDVE